MEYKKKQQGTLVNSCITSYKCPVNFGFNYSILRTTRGQCGSIGRLVIFQNNDFFVILPSTIVKKVMRVDEVVPVEVCVEFPPLALL